nr:immunoglobulin light chain junction region [Macaca mulatta]MOX47731.1 immunoglobulin light chain junction region [Macaca mulatta]MOX47770.1 immunoglobulin light chain junction region [Macaca mulatta]MOX47852.1 immunoglobulin light chain junction region [Macaca mulatta]MOX47909.1 immunoglobulin light chain junction region [Macaca mulatta]
CQQESEWPRTF